MAALVSKDVVTSKVAEATVWWVGQRMDKLRQDLHDSMSVNPFLIPILFELHTASTFGDLAELLIAGHLMTGHNTGFGKLVDERILPSVFGTVKLTQEYRGGNAPLKESCFDDIDHIVPRPGNKPALLSLKAGRWTIQLAAAVNLNRSFADIYQKHQDLFSEVIVGVFYGREATLTDKYDILRGINRGKVHDVVDLQRFVRVFAGRQFWAWVNGDEQATQDWVLDGIITGLQSAKCRTEAQSLLNAYKATFNASFTKHINTDGSVNWHAVLAEING